MSRQVLATKWRNDVAMGVSPWKRNPHHPVSPEGTTGTSRRAIHVALDTLNSHFEVSVKNKALLFAKTSPLEFKI